MVGDTTGAVDSLSGPDIIHSTAPAGQFPGDLDRAFDLDRNSDPSCRHFVDSPF